MPNLLDQLKEQRATARTAADDILTRAASEQRDPAPDELAEYQAQVVAEREAADRMEQERDRQLAEVRAMATRGRQPALSPGGRRPGPPVPLRHLRQEPSADRGVQRAAGRRVAHRRP